MWVCVWKYFFNFKGTLKLSRFTAGVRHWEPDLIKALLSLSSVRSRNDTAERMLQLCHGSSGDALTRFLCGVVDGGWLRSGASGIEGGHREVVRCVCFQPRDVNQCVVSSNAHFANGVRLCVIFPVHDLAKKVEVGDGEMWESWSWNTFDFFFSFLVTFKFIFDCEIGNITEGDEGRDE